jgi:hypothetical protein
MLHRYNSLQSAWTCPLNCCWHCLLRAACFAKKAACCHLLKQRQQIVFCKQFGDPSDKEAKQMLVLFAFHLIII